MKKDFELGLRVRDYLISKGVETPLLEGSDKTSDRKKIGKIKKHFAAIMEVLDLDLADDSLIDTPTRVAEMYVNELYSGLDYANFPKMTAVLNKMECRDLVLVSDIGVNSTCEHHFVTIDGLAHIAYIPTADTKIIGLSKFDRLVNFFASRPQVQERLTSQIFYALEYILGTSNIAITIDAVHFCMKSRGVRSQTGHTITSKLGGLFLTTPHVRAEFIALSHKK